MRVIIADSPEAVARMGAEQCIRLLQDKPAAVLGLATGSTPIALYAHLIQRRQQGEVSFRQVRTFNLDEYIGIAPQHPQSYRSFMQKQLFDHIDILPENTHIPSGMGDPVAESRAYEDKIRSAGGIDLQILGLGRNGHIGFNEPTSSLSSRTRAKTLTQETIRDNSRFFSADEEQPHLAITMGIGTILDARKVMLLAAGAAKADAVKAMVEGPVSAMHPASALQMHPSALVIVDTEAASKLELIDYYRWVQSETLRVQGAYL
ncbi:glucosamine-6-phosphate deaminase [Hahella aquimaris]|uniref:glucosamine-6-phosphate deaminase n=1 Tax=Hahella sp. HNIBRBA332 TaxID=3015983 RepID=UPI00273B584B|nr:glucosamine-6-phosphate deaminase [Hahella sp. HNIBRBA332]WLQ13117.1 glucosamine-6-phosphate deaminase [Hahella sp. HNIBRBA332]